MEKSPSANKSSSANKSPLKKSFLLFKIYRILFRFLCICCILKLWFVTQDYIGSHITLITQLSGQIYDRIHILIHPITDFLNRSPKTANLLLIASSIWIDIFTCFILLLSLFGSTIRPLLGLLLGFSMRQICQMIILLPLPEGMIWRDPGFPSLFVSYDISNDFFFSGHTSLAMLGAIELFRSTIVWPNMNKIALFIGLMFVFFEASTVIVLKAHWTMDVITAILASCVAATMARKLAPKLDKLLP